MRQTSLSMIHELARRDPRVVFIGSDLGPGTLSAFREEFPERFFMEGVAEQNIIGMAAGLALDGFIPYVNTIATFLTRRCYEQIAIDVCLHNLPVRLIGSGGGLVYAPLGPTHLAIEDVAIMRALPNMSVLAPADAEEMRRLMPETLTWPGPIYLRLAKGGDPVLTDPQDGFAIGRAILRRPAGDALIVTTGVLLGSALGAAEALAAEGIHAGVLHVPTIKPLDHETILGLASRVKVLITVEEHTLTGGLGSAVAELLADCGPTPGPRLHRLGIPDIFPKEYGSQSTMLQGFGLDSSGVAAAVRQALNLRSN